MGNLKELTKGLIKENPTLVGLLGMCPTLAVTTQAVNGIGMGLATAFVLVGSNIVISLLKRIIPKAVKLPCYIVIIAGFVTLISFLLHGFIPSLYDALGTFLNLITVNCIILGRAEMFACKNKVIPSALDGLWHGTGLYSRAICNGFNQRNFRIRIMDGDRIAVYQPAYVRICNVSRRFHSCSGVIIALVNKFAGRKPPQKWAVRAVLTPQAAVPAEKGGEE